jgi:hypothetical protein
MADNQLSTNININWQEIFDAIGESENGTIKARASYRLACGVAWEDVANQLGVTRGTIAGWLKDDEGFRRAIELIRENLASFIDSRLHLRISQSDSYADWLLSLPNDGIFALEVSDSIKKELIKERGLMARKYLDIATAGRQQNKEPVRSMQMNLNITEDTLRVLLERNRENEIDGESKTVE